MYTIYWEALSWVLVALSLIGNVFVIQKKVIGQWLWIIGNTGWVAYNLHLGAHAQAFLFFVYSGLCAWGIISWTKADKLTKLSAAKE